MPGIAANTLSIFDVVKYYLYGSLKMPDDYDDRLRPAANSSDDGGISLDIDAADFMATGPGRYANLSQVPLIQMLIGGPSSALTTFRNDYLAPGQKTITVGELIAASLDASEIKTSLSQYNMDTGSADYAARTYIWSSEEFRLNDDAVINFSDPDHPTITNVSLRPFEDNFDYYSDNSAIQASNALSMVEVDPYAIGRTVSFHFVNKDNIVPIDYNAKAYGDDVKRFADQANGGLGSGLGVFVSATEEIKSSDILDYDLDDGGSVIYGSDANNVIDGTGYYSKLTLNNVSTSGKPNFVWISSDSDSLFYNHVATPGDKTTIVVAGAGDDFVTSGDGSDQLYGDSGNDTLVGGGGADVLNGGDDNDIMVGGISNATPSASLLTTEHSEWDDGQRDTFYGGAGHDSVYIYSDYTSGEIQNPDLAKIISSQIDYVDATDDDFSVFYQFKDYLENLTSFELTTQAIQTAIQNFPGNDHYDFGTVTLATTDGGTYQSHVVGVEYGNDVIVSVSVYPGGVSRILGGLLDFGNIPRPDIHGTNGDDFINGSNGSERLYGGDGNDTFSESGGNDSYYGDDDGTGTSGGGTGNSSAPSDWVDEVDYQGKSTDFTFNVGGDGQLLASDGQKTDALYGIERIYFATDNFMVVVDDLVSGTVQQSALNGTSGDDNLIGSYRADVITGGAGNDSLSGGGGGDTYVYARGDGDDIITDGADYMNDVDVLKLADLNANDVSVSSDQFDLVVTVLSDGSQIRVTGQYSSNYRPGIERIEFADGTALDFNDLVSIGWVRGTTSADFLEGRENYNDTIIGAQGDDYLIGHGGSDNYVYNRGDGNDVIDDEGYSQTDIDELQLNGIGASDIAFAKVGTDLTITDTVTGSVITVLNQFSPWNAYSGIERIAFSDGNSIGFDALQQLGWINGTGGDDNLIGTTDNDILHGGLGNDILVGQEGSDTYRYASGDGNDTIDDQSTVADEVNDLVLTDLSKANVSLQKVGDALVITDLGTNQSITVADQFEDPFLAKGIEKIEFADGNSLYAEDIQSAGWIVGSDNAETLNGTTGDDVIIGHRGDDVLNGGAGSDRYYFNAFDGNDTINEIGNSADQDELHIGDTNFIKFDFVKDGDDLLVKSDFFAEYDEQIRITGQFSSEAGSGVESIKFSSGIALDRSGIEQALSNHSAGYNISFGNLSDDVLTGTTADEALYGGDGDDILTGGAGNDYLEGGNGNDTYKFTFGDGQDVIEDRGSTSDIDTLMLGTGISASDVTITNAVNGDDLLLAINGSSDSVLLRNQLVSNSGGVDQIAFADGTTWDRSTILSHAVAA